MGEQQKPKLVDRSIDLVSFDAHDKLQMEMQSINSFYAIAQESFLNKSYRIAVIYLRKILQIDNSYLSAYKLLAKIFQIKGQLKKAAEVLRQAIDINFRDAELHYQLGYIYYLQGNKIGFARECTKALVVNPSYSKAFYALALLHFENKRYVKAKEELDKCLKLNPNDGEAHMLLARVLIRQKDFLSARKAIENVLRYEPNNQKANYYLGEIAFFLKDYATALNQYLSLGKTTAKSQNRIMQAFDLIKENIDRNFKKNIAPIESLMELASLYYQVGQLQNARKTLKKLLDKNPKYLPARINYGLIYVYDDQYLKGMKIYLDVLKESPMNQETKINLNKAFQLAEKYFLKNWDNDKNKQELLEIYMLMQVYDKAALAMWELKSTKYARKILEKVSDKNMPIYRIYQAASLFVLGELKEAGYILKSLESAKHKMPALFYFLGLLEKSKDNYVEAYRYFEKAKSIDPDYWLIDRELQAITKLELKKIQKLLQKEPNNLKLNLEYIDLLILIGSYQKALLHMKKLKKSDLEVVDLSEKMDKVVTLYEKELESKLEQVNPAPEIFLDLGEIYLYKKRFNESFLLLQNGLQQYPKNEEIKKYYKFVVKTNIEVYEQLLQNQPTSMVYYNLAVLYAVEGNKKDALFMLQDAVAKDKRLAIQSRYEDAFKQFKTDDRFRLITLIEGEDKNIYKMQD